MSVQFKLRPEDQSRAKRAIMACGEGDMVGFSVVVAEARSEPNGVVALVYALAGFAAELVASDVPDPGERRKGWGRK